MTEHDSDCHCVDCSQKRAERIRELDKQMQEMSTRFTHEQCLREKADATLKERDADCGMLREAAGDSWAAKEKAEAELATAYRRGYCEGVTEYAWWKDGVQYVGTTGKTLRAALEGKG